MFTKKTTDDKMKISNFEKLSEINQSNIKSAFNAMESGILSKNDYYSNVAQNGGVIEKNVQSNPEKNNYSGQPLLDKRSPEILEKMEKQRIVKATKSLSYDRVPKDVAAKISKLRNVTPEDYYKSTGDDAEDSKRLNQLFGPKTDFSVTNFENNYAFMNEDEKIMFTSKAQSHFNNKGYTDEKGHALKIDGIFGPRTRRVYELYKKDSEKPEENIVNGQRTNDWNDGLYEGKIAQKIQDTSNVLDNRIIKNFNLGENRELVALKNIRYPYGNNQKNATNAVTISSETKKSVYDYTQELKSELEKNPNFKDNIYNPLKMIVRNEIKNAAAPVLTVMNCNTTKELLYHSLQQKPSDLTYGDNSRIANQIKSDKAFDASLKNMLLHYSNENYINEYIGVEFNEGDLYYSIHRATIYVSGKRNYNGKWELKCSLVDTFDFTEYLLQDYGFSLGNFANDGATILQKCGVINPYKVRVDFRVVR